MHTTLDAYVDFQDGSKILKTPGKLLAMRNKE